MFGQPLTPLVVATTAALNLTTPPAASPPPAPSAYTLGLTQLTFNEPTIFGIGGPGKPSPAECAFVLPVEPPPSPPTKAP